MTFRRPARTWTTPGGLQVRSGYELLVCSDLERRKVPFEYERDSLAIWLPMRGVKCGACGELGKATKSSVYTVDILLDNGRYIECKGKLSAPERTRLKALFSEWGGKFGRPLSLLLMRDNWITKAHKQRYSEWARRLGLDVHVGNSIPPEWIE